MIGYIMFAGDDLSSVATVVVVGYVVFVGYGPIGP